MRFYSSLLVSLLIVISSWCFIKCVSESQSRDAKFKEKYLETQYKAWSKMQEADNATLANICLKCSSFDKENDVATVEVHRRIKCVLTYGQGGGQSDDVTLDIFQCKIQYRNAASAVYYLAEGYDEGSAFKCFLHPPNAAQQKIVLGGEVQNIWNQTVHPSAK